jgi:RNA polymerase sigma factor (sigma-70 family)
VRIGARDNTRELRRTYRQNVRAVYAFLACSVPPATAEDLTSETFERVVRSWSSYDASRASERTWILAIARNLLTDHFRRQREQVSVDDNPALVAESAASDRGIQRVLDADELRSWLSLLGDREREIVALRYAADQSAARIGAMLGLSEANVHQILSRTLRRLRDVATTSRTTPEAALDDSIA